MIRVAIITTSITLSMTACITKQNPYPDPPFTEAVADANFFDFTTWEHRCFPMPVVSPEIFEEVLNFYGSKGWELTGFINENGRTMRYCLKRKH